MKLSLIVHVICSLCFAITMTLAISLSKPGCPQKCGNVTIPYPFGIGSKCSANSSFTVTCLNSTTTFLSSIKMEVLNISLFGTVMVNQPVSPLNCSVERRTGPLSISLKGSPFTISAHYNSLVVLGCKNSVWLRANKTTTVGGCLALCDAKSLDTSCNGVNCCQIKIPARLQDLQYTYQSSQTKNNSFCGYVFFVGKTWLKNGDYKSYKGLHRDLSNPFDREFGFTPLVLEWEFNIPRNLGTNVECKQRNDYLPMYVYAYYSGYSVEIPYRGQSLLDSYEQSSYYYAAYAHNDYVSSVRYCSCSGGYEGNPYLHEGCTDIDECTLKICPPESICINKPGSFYCDESGRRYDYEHGNGNDRTRHIIKAAFIIIGSVRGSLILLIFLVGAAWKSSRAITELIKASRRKMFYERNGGLLLDQHLSATQNGLERTKLFSSNELERATDHYNENRILGRGGQGTVYKGMLTDGRIVAVKKSKRVEDGDLEVFINEVVILSQVNHRNVVKLLGCCLETEVPRLVYEFIPNGTLFQHIHDPSEEIPLTWEMRVRIAREVAGALAYLHSSSSAPIYHRDIKSTNILLDDKYRAKVADFGTSRSVSIDQTHLTTRVVGTFGYMDPEYFRSSHFTEKSDVYSFGVVMVELLTGEKAISAIRVETGRGLATHFLHSMEENQLFEIVDTRVLEEAKKEEIAGIAELARRCLNLNGRRRPTMKEVAVELEGIQMLKDGSEFLQNQSREQKSIDFVDSEDFSSITGSLHFDIPDGDGDPPVLDEP
ncbi:hypothetical protein ACS0TY_033458 [Phlomoides rotata]